VDSFFIGLWTNFRQAHLSAQCNLSAGNKLSRTKKERKICRFSLKTARKRALVINPSFPRMRESRGSATTLDSGLRRNDGDEFVTKARKRSVPFTANTA
jgi:hypothetical protein